MLLGLCGAYNYGKIILPYERINFMPVTGEAIDRVVHNVLRRFCDSDFDDSDNIINAIGLVSGDGVDLALDLEDELSIEIDPRENPIVDDTRHRGRTVRS